MPDGLYRVTTRYLCAGLVISGGCVLTAAPILWKRMDYYLTIAVRVGDDPAALPRFNA